MKNPCRTCEERRAGCHAECEKYKEFYQYNREKNNNAKYNMLATNYLRDSIAKSVRKKIQHKKRK